ncbi:MAG: hypothetical protein WBV71_17650, partial [Roseobacter sp.]
LSTKHKLDEAVIRCTMTNERVRLDADLHRFLVSVCCVAVSSHSRPEIRSFGSEWSLTTRADATAE